MFKIIIINLLLASTVCGVRKIFKRTRYWRLFGYDIDGVIYTSDSDFEHRKGSFTFNDVVLEEHEKFLIQKNLVPNHVAFGYVSIPRTRPGIPFTINTLTINNIDKKSLVLTPFPSSKESKYIISVYETAVDGCERIWFVDTGFIDIPGVRKQAEPPTLYIYGHVSRSIVYKNEIDSVFLKDGVTSGLRSLTVDYIFPCHTSYAYISDDNGNAIIAFSFEEQRFWRINRRSSGGEAWTFPIPQSILIYAENVIRYRKPPNETFIHYSNILKTTEISQRFERDVTVDLSEPKANPRGVIYDRNYDSNILFFTNENRTNLYCWNMDTPMNEDYIQLLTEVSPRNDYYISAINTIGAGFYFMVNRFRNLKEEIYDEKKINFAAYQIDVAVMLKDTICAQRTICSNFIDEWRNKIQKTLTSFKYVVKYVSDDVKKDDRRFFR